MNARSWLSRLLGLGSSEAANAKPPMPTSKGAVPAHKRGLAQVAPQEPAAEADVSSIWQVGDVILDLYEVKQVFTSGGMGLVYRVYHRGWNIDLAVKSPRPQYFQTEAHRENFIREAETWVNLGLHLHIASCYYVRTLGGIPRIFAEYVEGGSLADWIHQRKLYEGSPEKTLERILDVAIQFARSEEHTSERV